MSTKARMDQVVQQFIDAASEPRKASHNWQPGKPYNQPYYTYSSSDKQWTSVNPSTNPSSPTTTTPVTKFTIYSWNIDFLLPCGTQRLTTALRHLHSLISSSRSSSSSSSIILLQEMTNADLRTIQAQRWIQTDYHVSDISNEYWASNAYGTCTLMPKTAQISRLFRVHYEHTAMERDAMFVDLESGDGKVVRVCNTHLESLALEPQRRPGQMECAARFMKGEGVGGSVLGGDLNAIQPADRMLHVENGLADAYLEMGGEEGREDGMTWGQMARTRERERFGLSRMDKLFFCGGVRVERFETFGFGVEVEGEAEREELVKQGLQKPWVTDHLGVVGEFCIV